jgi:hypothetical protein
LAGSGCSVIARSIASSLLEPSHSLPRERRAVRGNFSCKSNGLSTLTSPQVVLRGLDPRIHAFLSAPQSRGWPGQARPRRIIRPLSSLVQPQNFPRTALPQAGEG